MAGGRLETTWRQVRELFGDRAAREAADAHLLASFVARGDQTAFAELVRRHGPMVRGVCRRVLPNPHDAEDACQAALLVLSHKAASIRGGDSLAGWLHRVALHAALRLRRNLARRTDRAPLPSEVAQAERDDVSWREVRGLVDEELARLPERFRQPLILCYLEGRTRDEAAEELGWALSTFRGRLERGRDRLRRRLERRGVTLSAALLATLAARHAEAALPTINASSRAATLAAEVMRSMFLSKVKAAALGCLAVLLLCVTAGAAAYRSVAAEPAPRPETAAPAEAPKEDKPPAPPGQQLVFVRSVQDLDKLWVVDAKEAADVEKTPRSVALDGVLPFAAWPAGLTREQQYLRLAYARQVTQLLETHTVEFRATRGPDVGDALRYTVGPTKVEQQWKGQVPSELCARDAFHINVLLIQEGYSPFVRDPRSKWDKKVLACYETAEQYAELHKKGIWADPAFAKRLKESAEKWVADENPARVEELLQKDPVAAGHLKKIAELQQYLARVREIAVNPDAEPTYRRARKELEDARKALAERRAELLRTSGK
jgi:RNA polymerase sigma factor (sigma-70 family)